MKINIQIRNSYNIWCRLRMQRRLKIQAYKKGYDNVVMTNAIVLEWWAHNIGYYITLPFIKNTKIKALNERFKHVDLIVKVEGKK